MYSLQEAYDLDDYVTAMATLQQDAALDERERAEAEARRRGGS